MAPEGIEGVVNDGQASGAASGSTASTATPTSTGSTGAASTGNPTPATKWEDDPRAKGMIADLQKERKARQEYETQLVEERRRVAALAGTRIPSKEENEEQQVRERFAQLYPELAGLTSEDIKAIRELKANQDQLQQTVEHHWTAHSKTMLESAYKEIAAEVGDLSPRQKQRIAALYIAEAQADPEFLSRHDAGDPALVKEFVKNYLEDTVEPVRRKITAAELGRNRIVPQGGGRSVPAQGGKPIDVKNDKEVMDFLGRGFVERGGNPGRSR